MKPLELICRRDKNGPGEGRQPSERRLRRSGNLSREREFLPRKDPSGGTPLPLGTRELLPEASGGVVKRRRLNTKNGRHCVGSDGVDLNTSSGWNEASASPGLMRPPGLWDRRRLDIPPQAHSYFVTQRKGEAERKRKHRRRRVGRSSLVPRLAT